MPKALSMAQSVRVCEIRKFESNSNVFLYSNSIRTRPTVFAVSNIALASLKICYRFKVDV